MATTFNRRIFCLSAAACTITSAFGQQPSANPARIDPGPIDRDRIVSTANSLLKEPPQTITAFPAAKNPEGPNSFYSEPEDWWNQAPPNATKPVYSWRDGTINPIAFTAHRDAVLRLSLAVPTLVAAWLLTQEDRYANHAIAHLRAWFITPETRMLPNAEHAQAFLGLNKGRPAGIEDTIYFVEVFRAASFLKDSPLLPKADYAALRSWCSSFAHWMTESIMGMNAQTEKNYRGTTWMLQCAQYSKFSGDDAIFTNCRHFFRERFFITQINPLGSMPQELARVNPYRYSLYNLDLLAALCEVLSDRFESFWKFQTIDGRGMFSLMTYIYPFLKSKSAWTQKADDELFRQLPLRRPALLFAARAFNRPEYAELWQATTPAEPTEPALQRTFPIREPMLWTRTPPV